MDTPDRSNINNTPVSQFQDSPVFNYMSNLSPIKPVRSTNNTHTLNSLNLSSPPSIFTSPHVNYPSRFYNRHNPLDTSKPKVSSEDANNIYSREENSADWTNACHESSELQKNAYQKISIGDASIGPPQALKYNYGGLGYNPLLCGPAASSDMAYVPQGFRKDSVEGGMHLPVISQIEANNEARNYDSDNIITGASDMLMFNSPNVAEAFNGLNKQLNPPISFSTLLPQSATNNGHEMHNVTEAFKGLNRQLNPSISLSNVMPSLPQSATNSGHGLHIVNPVASGSEQKIEYHRSESIAATYTVQRQGNLANVALMATNPSQNMDDELVYMANHGMWRRCLDFEQAMQRKNTDKSNTNSSRAKPDERQVGNEKQIITSKQSCFLLGLHMNALETLKDHNSIKNEKLSSERQPSLPSSPSSLQPSASQEHQLMLVPVSSERDLEQSENDVQPAEVFQQNSPKKKRHKLEPAGEGESCKRCNCKKSKCLKLYCECFAAGVYCSEPCACQDCFNKPINEDIICQTRKQIESRNPLAFVPKFSVPEIGGDPSKTPASVRHKRGCNCKKSSCLKKYCECFQGGVGCSLNCRCEGCKNSYGRKDVEAEPIEETETCEKGEVEKASQKTETQNIIEDHPDSALPTTPLRSMLPVPFSSERMPPRSFVPTMPASGYLNASQCEPKVESVQDDESPPMTCITTCSPKGKRISSPTCEFGSSSTGRGGRNLMLQSIPSFPSLAPHSPPPQ